MTRADSERLRERMSSHGASRWKPANLRRPSVRLMAGASSFRLMLRRSISAGVILREIAVAHQVLHQARELAPYYGECERIRARRQSHAPVLGAVCAAFRRTI